MTRWEHLAIDLNNVPRKNDDLSLLRQLGQDRWELVAIAPNQVAYFKRRIEEPLPLKPRSKRNTAPPVGSE